ncbi:MAG: hypothetical protein G8237_09705 [Magnetococcales bacterium]|nr:hypothetical protein [Magnetococcales bacterium]NGZ06618.1 hypothetical protein [Magnetococcales bacterium]
MPLVKSIPLFAFMLAILNSLIFLQPTHPEISAQTKLLTLPLTSGAILTFTISDILILTGVVILYIEIFKATRSGTESIVDHLFSMVVFVAFLIEFLIFRPAGTNLFLTMTLMSFLDVVAGFTVTISTSRRDIGRS